MQSSSKIPLAQAVVVSNGAQLEAPLVPIPSKLNESSIDKERLTILHEQKGFPKGLAKDVYSNSLEFSLRIWVVDNSGSMKTQDGNLLEIVNGSKSVKVVKCSRWEEIKETVMYHIDMAALLRAPSVFRILNPDRGCMKSFSVAVRGDEKIDEDVSIGKEYINLVEPKGTTPLARHVREIKDQILRLIQNKVLQGKRVAIIIATDGLPSNRHGESRAEERKEFIKALKSLEGLPIWIVIRLCTDRDDIVEFYNDLDSKLEYSIEVLDDFQAEGKEINFMNPWINYCVALHRCREMGYKHRMFDLLDERLLSKDEMRMFCILLFGEDEFDGAPNPVVDWKGFSLAIKEMANKENAQICSTRKVKPMISVAKLNSRYGGSSSCAIS